MPSRKPIIFTGLFLLTILEIGFFTFWRKKFDPHILPFLFLGVQLCIGILPLILYKKRTNLLENLPVLTHLPNASPLSKKSFFKKLLKDSSQFKIWLPLSILVLLGVYLSYGMLADLIKHIAINPSYSDVIPQVQVFCKRALVGQYPYAPITDFGYTMPANYLPTQWMPYLPAQVFKFDPRFITFWIFACVYCFFSIKLIKSTIPVLFKVALIALPIIFISAIHDHDQGVLSVSVELLIMAYYWLTGISLTSNSRFFQIISLVLCLMSRFSLVFWLPLYVFMLWTKDGLKPTLKFCFWIFAGCLALYGPFLLRDPYLFYKAQAYYDLASAGEWGRGDEPVHLYNGLGFAIFFHNASHDTVANLTNQVLLLKKVMLAVTPSVSLILGWVWWRFKDKMDFGLFAVCSLKISLAFFYAFIQIPYSYLYLTPIVLSWVVLYSFYCAYEAKTLIPVK